MRGRLTAQPHRSSFSLWLAVLTLASFACSEDIGLGSECREQPCPRVVPVESDARVRDASAPSVDAALPIDASVKPVLDTSIPRETAAPPPLDASQSRWGQLPNVVNPSFELVPGRDYGEVTVVNPMLQGTMIEPWATCQPLPAGVLTAVRAERDVSRTVTLADGGVMDTPVTPSDEQALVVLSAFPSAFFPIQQVLEQPLQAGVRYSFALDVQSLVNEPALTVQVLGSSSGCLEEEALAEQGPASTRDWQTLCFDFVPKQAHGRLLIRAKSTFLGSGSLAIDNLREASDALCPAD